MPSKNQLINFVRQRFLGGFFLSTPLIYMFYWGDSVTDADNNLWLLLMAILGIATLPGSLILLLVGMFVGLSHGIGMIGQFVGASAVVLSVVNAHLMGTLYFGGLFFRKRTDQSDDS